MSPVGSEVYTEADGFPRVSGDEPHRAYYEGRQTLFSPRERG